MLSTKKGKEAYVEPVVENGGYRFTVKVSDAAGERQERQHSLAAVAAPFLCLMSGVPITIRIIMRSEAKAGRMGARLMAIVAEGDRGPGVSGDLPRRARSQS